MAKTSPVFKLYYSSICPYCKPIYHFVNTTKLPHEAIHLDLKKGEQRTPEYLSINPFGKVPAIVEQDGWILFESSTILRYLCNTRDVPDHWYSKDPRKRSQVDLFFDWFQVGTKNFSSYSFAKVPSWTSKFPCIGDPLENLENSLKDIERNFLRDRKYLAGDEISLADIQIIYFFASLDVVDYELDKFPKLKEWKERVLVSGIKVDYLDYLQKSKEFRENMLKKEKESSNNDTKNNSVY